MSVSVIIPTYRNPKYLDICLKSAIENRVNDINQIIVVVDGFFEESKDILNKYPVGFLNFDNNQGMQSAINTGVAQADSEYVFVINDDNVFGQDWDKYLNECINVLYDEKKVLTINQVEPIGPSMYNFNINNLGETADNFNYDEWLKYEASIRRKFYSFDGRIFPFLIKKKYFMAVGGLDTFYNGPNWCDIDFFLKLELLDFSFLRTQLLHLYHFGSVVTRKGPEANKFIQKQNDTAGQFYWKWGYVPDIVGNVKKNNTKYPDQLIIRGIEFK